MIDRTRFRHPPVLFPFRKTLARFRSSLPSLPPCLLVSLSALGPGACQVLLTIVCESVSCYLSFSLRLFKEIVVIRRN